MRNLLHRANDEEKIAYRKKLMIFGFFLLLSLVFWFINALSKSYITNISYPVRYTDLPEGKILVGDTPEDLVLKISAHGYSIVRYKLSSRYIPVSIPLHTFTVQHLNNNDSLFFIQSRFAREHLNAQLSYDIQILEIKPDTLYFRFAKLKTKKLPVIVNLTYEPEKQMIAMGAPVAVPDSVIATGPDHILDTTYAVNTVKKNLGIISQTVKKDIDLQKPKDIDLSHTKVNITVALEKYTEKTLTVPLEVINLPDSIQIITFPDGIEITCQVGLSNYHKVQPTLFRTQVDFRESVDGTGSLTVFLTKQPDLSDQLTIHPKKQNT